MSSARWCSGHESTVRDACQQKAREILTTTIQRYAASHTAEITVSTVDIPSDEMKGRIIGREGRNIRAFEKATGVDVIVDDTPGIVVVTGFDSIRREIAKISLEKLIQDGRIHPTRIEEIVTETQEEMEQHIRKIGQEAAQEAEVIGLHEKLLDYLGRLKFPNQLLPERAAALDRGGFPDRHDGRGAWPFQLARRGGAGSCTISARPPTTRWKGDTRLSAPSSPGDTASPARSSTPRWDTTTTSGSKALHRAGRRGRRHQRQPPRSTP